MILKQFLNCVSLHMIWIITTTPYVLLHILLYQHLYLVCRQVSEQSHFLSQQYNLYMQRGVKFRGLNNEVQICTLSVTSINASIVLPRLHLWILIVTMVTCVNSHSPWLHVLSLLPRLHVSVAIVTMATRVNSQCHHGYTCRLPLLPWLRDLIFIVTFVHCVIK